MPAIGTFGDMTIAIRGDLAPLRKDLARALGLTMASHARPALVLGAPIRTLGNSVLLA